MSLDCAASIDDNELTQYSLFSFSCFACSHYDPASMMVFLCICECRLAVSVVASLVIHFGLLSASHHLPSSFCGPATLRLLSGASDAPHLDGPFSLCFVLLFSWLVVVLLRFRFGCGPHVVLGLVDPNLNLVTLMRCTCN